MDAIVTAPLTLVGALICGYVALIKGLWLPKSAHDAIVTELRAQVAFRDALILAALKDRDVWTDRYLSSASHADRSTTVAAAVVTAQINRAS